MPSTSNLLQPTISLRVYPTFHVVNLGCKVNKVESDTIAVKLAAHGLKVVGEADASLIVVNTCTVTGEADKKARKAVRHALSVAPLASVVVTGCAAAIDAATFAEMDERVIVIPREELIARLSEGAGSGIVSDGSTSKEALRLGEGFRTRIAMKIQDGCDHACTYCIVHVARGRAKSVPAAEVLAEAQQYLARGAKELVLTGIDLGSYRDGSWRLEHLVDALIQKADEFAAPGELPARIRASSLEPHSITEGFMRLLAESEGRLCRHVHLPLQSGSSRVLREMARPYDADRYRDLVAELYRVAPSLSLTTDIICGFPGESDDDFNQTLELAAACRFSKIHVFPYSKRAGTPAATRDDQVDPDTKRERCAQLRSLSDELREADRSRRAGTTELAVVEGETALTESYHEVPAAGARPGTMISFTW